MANQRRKELTLTAEWLRENLVYEPETGIFLWRVRGPGRTMGKILGTKVWPGYVTMKVNNFVYYAHRLAWLYTHGEWPKNHIDHIDGDKMNNSIKNLREATPAQNAAGRPSRRRVAAARGVMPHGKGFVARIHKNGVRQYLGYFSTLDAAVAAYDAAAKEKHGDFAHKGPAKHFPTITGKVNASFAEGEHWSTFGWFKEPIWLPIPADVWSLANG